MAKIDMGILGAFSGKVGPVVGFVLNGRPVMRSASPFAHNPRTARQQAGRGVFGALSRLARDMRAALAVGLRGAGAALGMSARNLFISLNRSCVGMADGVTTVDYSRVQVADGHLEGVEFGAVQREGLRVAVSFSCGHGTLCPYSTDYVYLFAFAPQWGEGVLSTPAQRREGRVSLTLPAFWAGSEVQLYGFVWDRVSECSPSVWLGRLELEVDEGLQVGRDKLVDHEDGDDRQQSEEPEGQAGEDEAVAALEAHGEPVDDHAYEEEEEGHPVVTYDFGHLGEVPVGANLCDHLAGGAPGHHVGGGGVEVGTAAEEEACETDEHKGEAGEPDGLGAAGGTSALRQQVEQGVADEAHEDDEVQHVDQRRVEPGLEEREKAEGGGEGEEVGGMGLAAPPLVDQYAEAVEAAPGDEVEGGTVPEAAEEHGVHVVDVGAEVVAVTAVEKPAEEYPKGHNEDGDGEEGAVQAEGRDGHHGGQEEVGEEACRAVSAEGYVEVVAQPVGEGDVPAAPEVGGVLRLVGRVEVERQVEAHEKRHADGDIGIAREVGVDLQRVEHQCGEVLEGGVERGVVEDAVDEVDGQVVAQDEFLHQTVENPEEGDAELAA